MLRAYEFFKSTVAYLIIVVHTHVSILHKFQVSVLVNLGLVGQHMDGNPRARYMIIDISGGIIHVSIRRVEENIDKTTTMISKIGLLKCLISRLYLGQ